MRPEGFAKTKPQYQLLPFKGNRRKGIVSTARSIAGVGDFNGDGKADAFEEEAEPL
jgi:hypothetical protein